MTCSIMRLHSLFTAMLNPEKFCDMLRYIEEPSRMPIVVSLDQNTDTRCQPSQCKFIPAA